MARLCDLPGSRCFWLDLVGQCERALEVYGEILVTGTQAERQEAVCALFEAGLGEFGEAVGSGDYARYLGF